MEPKESKPEHTKMETTGSGGSVDGQVSKDHHSEEDVKKRPLAPIKDEEPLAKKSKPTKLDK